MLTDPRMIVINDASCLIDLRKGGLLPFLILLPWRLVIPLPVRSSELLDFTEQEWSLLDEGRMETYDLPSQEVAEAFAVKKNRPKLSPNDCFCLVTTRRKQNAALLTGDAQLRRAALEEGLRVHGVLWVVDELKRLGLCPDDTLAKALEIWREDRAVFLPGHEIANRLRLLRKRQ